MIPLEKNISQDNLIDKARYEIKFIAENSHYYSVQQWIKNHGMCFFEEYPSRIVNNIYFDNYDLESYAQNLSGISSRSKIRLRWYGDLQKDTSQASKLELKIRRNKIGWKYSEEISFKNNLKDITKAELTQIISSQLSDDFKNRFNISNIPILVNSYERYYYISMDKRVRVTLDKNISYYDQRSGNKLNLVNLTNSPNILVLEFKSAARDVDFCRQAIETVFLQPSKCSKYVLGVQRILGM